MPALLRMKFIEAVSNSLFGIIAYRTGIQQYKVGRFYVGGCFVIPGFENGSYNLTVRKIHLAAVCLNV
jgi:hypothetical protein